MATASEYVETFLSTDPNQPERDADASTLGLVARELAHRIDKLEAAYVRLIVDTTSPRIGG